MTLFIMAFSGVVKRHVLVISRSQDMLLLITWVQGLFGIEFFCMLLSQALICCLRTGFVGCWYRLIIVCYVALQAGKKFAKTPTEDKDYLRGKSMLQKLDLLKYEKNLRKGMLTDSTLHLVNDRFVTFIYIVYNFLVHCPSLDRAWGMRIFHEERCSLSHIEWFSNEMFCDLSGSILMWFVQCLERRTDPTRTQASDLGLHKKVCCHDLLSRFKELFYFKLVFFAISLLLFFRRWLHSLISPLLNITGYMKVKLHGL